MALVVTEKAMPDLVVNLEAKAVPLVEVPALVVSKSILKGGISMIPPPLIIFIMPIKKITKNKYPLVRVVWRDSNIYRLQDSIEYALLNYSIEIISTVGFLIGYKDENPIIARDLLSKDIDQRCSVVIPKENIISLVKIKTTSHNIVPDDQSILLRKVKDRVPSDKK